MASLRADRRLYLTADRSEVVEEGDERAAFLLAAEGRVIGPDDVSRYGLSHDGGRVVVPGQEVSEEKQAAPPEDKQAAPPEDKSISVEGEKGEAGNVGDYAEMGYQDLRRLASERDLDVPGRPKKNELIEALEASAE